MKRKNESNEVNGKRVRKEKSLDITENVQVYSEGDLVEASFKGSRSVFQAYVEKVYPSSKYYDLQYLDGDRASNVSYQVIHKLLEKGMSICRFSSK